MYLILSPLDWFALIWFACSWAGYIYYVSYTNDKKPNLSNTLTNMREQWIRAMLTREARITDITSLAALQRTTTFFASTSMFIIAGLLAVLGSADKAIQLVNALPFIVEHTKAAWEIKILLLALIYVYAFFKFSWSVRQYNFSLVMFGAAPSAGDKAAVEDYVQKVSTLLTAANKSFSHGLRSFTFSMAALAWLIQPYLFIVASSWIVAVVYRREFHSQTLIAMQSLPQK
ncbi:MAG: DUF599 domain-containing protein [Gammaproteobacteria bacterium]|nr:DUF599 domain-containing protein [Gammaproteobacteria bacterium]MDH5629003.1 DUF599 domain-containing protein [Gammaproteobacteria bacterium]